MAARFIDAFKVEDYRTCAEIKAEIERRENLKLLTKEDVFLIKEVRKSAHWKNTNGLFELVLTPQN